MARSSTSGLESFFVRNRIVITVLAVFIVLAIVGVIIGNELHLSNVDKEAESLYALELLFEDWHSELDSDNPLEEEILQSISEYNFRPNGYAATRKNYILGEIYTELGNYESAIKFFTQVAESSRGYLSTLALMRMGFLYEQSGSIDQAYEVFLRLVEEYDFPDKPRVLFTLGRLAEMQEEYENASRFYNQLIDEYSSSDWKNFSYNRIIELKSTNKLSE